MAASCSIDIRWGPVLEIPLVPLDAHVVLPFLAHLFIHVIPVVVEHLLEVVRSIVDPRMGNHTRTQLNVCLRLPDLSETTEFYGIAPSTSSTTLRQRQKKSEACRTKYAVGHPTDANDAIMAKNAKSC